MRSRLYALGIIPGSAIELLRFRPLGRPDASKGRWKLCQHSQIRSQNHYRGYPIGHAKNSIDRQPPIGGKTTLFNLLTGANQKVGNWPGVTVEKKFGYFELENQSIELVDLPGIYSLEQGYSGIDEKIAQDFLEQSDISLIINIVDATNLERSLVLTQQLMERGVPMLLVINMLDVARQQGITVSTDKLAQKLQLPIIEMIASQKHGIDELRNSLISTFGTVPPARENQASPW